MPLLTLTPGTRLGPYEVVALLGVGGMGEVYRATDTNLKRQVAIKVLPTSVAVERFEILPSPVGADEKGSVRVTFLLNFFGYMRSGAAGKK